MFGSITTVALDHVTDAAVILAASAKIRYEVIAFALSADGTGRVKIRSGSTVLTAFEMVAGSQVVLPMGDYRLFGAVNEALNLVTTGSVNVSGHVVIRQTPLTP